MRKRYLAPILLVAAAGLAATGCSSTPEHNTTVQMTRSNSSIEMAQQSGAAQYAAAALERARDKLAAANRALQDGDEQRALNLAEEAELDARLAAAQADRRQAQRSLEEINSGIDALRRETAK